MAKMSMREHAPPYWVALVGGAYVFTKVSYDASRGRLEEVSFRYIAVKTVTWDEG